MTTPEFIESLTRLSAELDDIQFNITKMEDTLAECKESLTNQPTDPEATRYEVGKEYEVSNGGGEWCIRKYAGYFNGRHYFKYGIEALAPWNHIREVQPDPRIGKVCVFWDEGEPTNLKNPKALDQLESIKANRFITGRNFPYKNCMLLTDYAKLIE